MTGLVVRVARKAIEAVDICTFELVSADGKALPAFTAGSHIDVHLPSGQTRPYSLCNDPAESHRYLIGVLREREGRGGSRTLHDLVNEGDELTIGAPRNLFPLVERARHTLLLAGGIGITPILCMAERLAALGESFELHYCVRTRARMAFHDRVRAPRFAGKVWLHVDDEAQAQKLDLAALLSTSPPHPHLYVCGPQGFTDAVLSQARAAAWPADRLHHESFSPAPGPQAGDGSFEVLLARSGRVVAVPRHQTVVAALAAAGVVVPTSCEQGVCGTCLTTVLDGEPDHRDAYLTLDERAANDRFLPCCSRALSARLVLDL